MIIRIDREEAFPLARERFIKTCGFDLEHNKKHQRMMDMGLKVLEDGKDGIDIRASLVNMGPEVFKDGAIHLDGEEVSCNYMSQIPEEDVKGVYFYMLTAGECYFSSEENIMDFLNADIWGTNFTDAGVEILTEQYIKPDMRERYGADSWLSEEFGPGYFGMPVIESKKFVGSLESAEIGVWVKDSGLMIPQKSITGFYLVYDRDDIKAEPSCMHCNGNHQGCAFCVVRPA